MRDDDLSSILQDKTKKNASCKVTNKLLRAGKKQKKSSIDDKLILLTDEIIYSEYIIQTYIVNIIYVII